MLAVWQPATLMLERWCLSHALALALLQCSLQLLHEDDLIVRHSLTPVNVHAMPCRHLVLSTNNIEKISSLSGLENLRILSLGRNLLKKIENVEPVAETLQELWLSYNQIEKLVRCKHVRGQRSTTNILGEYLERGLPAKVVAGTA